MIDYNQVLARTDALVREANSQTEGHVLRSTQVKALAKALTEEINKELQKIETRKQKGEK